MNIEFSGINWLAVGAADVAGFLLGAVFYGGLFTKPWVSAYGFTEKEVEDSKTKTGRNFAVYLVMGFVIAAAMAVLLNNLQIATAMDGAKVGAFVGLGFVATVVAMQVASGNYRFAAFLIDGAYYTVWYVLIGAILGGWR
jgi:RsiW-degrading membrane proteinase PrsW (M82 family)